MDDLILDDINPDDLLKLQDLFFNEIYSLYKFQYNHFNQCIEEIIPRYLKENPNKFYQSTVGSRIYIYRFIFEDVCIKPPIIPNTDDFMFP